MTEEELVHKLSDEEWLTFDPDGVGFLCAEYIFEVYGIKEPYPGR